MKKRSCIAVIPARSGSKRGAGKNLRKIFGKPLVQIAVEQAISSQLFSKVVVSTDSTEILDIACASGALDVGLRPAELSRDSSSSYSVVRYVIEQLGGEGVSDFVYTLPPTSPFRTDQHILEAHKLLCSVPDATGVLSCVEVPHRYSLEKQMCIDTKGILTPMVGEFPLEFEASRVGQRFSRNSAIYGVRSQNLGSGLAGSKPVAYQMSLLSSIDIDTEEDLHLAESLTLSAALHKVNEV